MKPMARRFEAVLASIERGFGVEVPFDVKEAFGSGRPPVRGTVNGAPFRTTIARRGGRSLLVFNREVREAAGIAAGDTVTIELERDDEPRVVETPPDLAAALDADPEARAFFERLSYTHRREYVRCIEEAKREETRRRRVEKAVAMLREGAQEP